MESILHASQSAICKLLLATTNAGKVTELAFLLKDLNCLVVGLADLPDAPPPPEETGATFAENALLKAEYYQHLTGWLTVADDSGLEVDALDGRPGVYSARYGGEGMTSAEQIQLLLGEMKNVPEGQRSARFVCCLALVGAVTENWLTQTFEGLCTGAIAHEPQGKNGFGYDPIFVDAETGRTFAELTQEEKAARSHRGKALRQLREFLVNLFLKEAGARWEMLDQDSHLT